MVEAMVLGGMRCYQVIELRLEDLQPTNKRMFVADGKAGHQRLIAMSAQLETPRRSTEQPGHRSPRRRRARRTTRRLGHPPPLPL
jgi:hypothetical protein